jgi:5-methyltetrahydrofolate--homocysteine methyltransferase
VKLLDGAMATALLQAAGLPADALPEAWLLARPEEVARVHAAHAAAGAEVVLTATFNLAGPRLRAAGIATPLADLARAAVRVARGAAPAAAVAGAVGPPLAPGAPTEEVRAAFAAAFRALADAGADLLWAESLPGVAEARAAIAAARALGRPAVVTFALRERGGALVGAAGEDGVDAIAMAAAEGAAAAGVNCAFLGTPLEAVVTRAAGRMRVPLVAKPSAGLPGAAAAPEAFARGLARLARAGATWVGGCCGAGPEHLAAAARALARQR